MNAHRISFEEAFKSGFGPPRVLIIAAHPDDEIIGAASVIWTTEDLEIVHVTDGSPACLTDAKNAGCNGREDYARLRWQELVEALRAGGRGTVPLSCLGFLDQECSFHLSRLVESIQRAISRVHPDLIITHSYEGGHPDHDATAFATRQAVDATHLGSRPLFVEMTAYHNGSHGIETGMFLGKDPGWERPFTSTERELKAAMLSRFKSQQGMLHHFSCNAERFRLAPRYNFLDPPHEGLLFYEQFPWGLTGAEWRKLAAQASRHPMPRNSPDIQAESELENAPTQSAYGPHRS